MTLGRRLRDEPDELESEPAAEPCLGGYRVAGDIEVRSKELEQELVETKAQLRGMEREVFAARKALRNRKALLWSSTGGIGALVGAVIGGIAYGIFDVPQLLIAATALGFVVGIVAGKWDLPDDDDKFPPAPPPRFYGG